MRAPLRLSVPAGWLACAVWLCLVALLLVGGPVRAQQPAAPSAGAPAELVLAPGTPSAPAWPALQRYEGAEPLRDWTHASLWRDRFVPMPGVNATLGLQPEPVWLRLPLRVLPGAEGVWVLDIDYPPLNLVSLYLVRDDMLVAQDKIGNHITRSERRQPGRAPATQFTLSEGRYDLWLQVQTSGAMVLPMTLSRTAVFYARALNEQMLQGLLTGLALCLLFYSLAQWLTLRDTLFLKYSLLLLGSLCFSLQLFGVGRQYLWGDWPWIEQHAAGFSALAAAAGSFLFIEHTLRGPDQARWWRLAMRGGAALCGLVALGYALGLLPLRVVTALMSVLGVVPALMGLRGAFRRARAGDQVGLTLLLAWAVYVLATAVMIGVIRGWMPVNFWTQHAFQFGATLDMLLFMRVLGLRTHAMAQAARQARRDLGVMASLAHTDPLTGLPNRRGLNAALADTLPHAGPGRLVALYVLDLDGFKPVNDRYGHDVGDELLVAVAQRLRAHIRSSDVVARVGGDEFVLMATALPDERSAHELGVKLCDAFVPPFEVAGAPVRVGLTAGYALSPLDGREAVELLKRADAAMYAGKQAGKQQLVRAAPSAI
ncbi:MAG: diguanylate cyclase [Hydrogenophaga sp.]|nr:diguanylate cyclase [Hydrogenophaga sp.]